MKQGFLSIIGLKCFEDPKDYVYDVAWSPEHPALFAAVLPAGGGGTVTRTIARGARDDLLLVRHTAYASVAGQPAANMHINALALRVTRHVRLRCFVGGTALRGFIGRGGHVHASSAGAVGLGGGRHSGGSLRRRRSQASGYPC